MGCILWSCLETVFKLVAFVFFTIKIITESPHREGPSGSLVVSAPANIFSTIGVKSNS